MLIRRAYGKSQMKRCLAVGIAILLLGLSMRDFAHFPASARAGLHLRSPLRGFHSRERVNVQDLINHIDLLCYLLLGCDHSLPVNISQ